MRVFDSASKGILHHISGNRIYVSQADVLYTAEAGGPLRRLACIPTGYMDRISSAFRLISRLRRRAINHVVEYRGKVVVMAFGRIWCLDAADGRLLGEPAMIWGSRPLALCASPYGLFYGEYRSNPERSPVRLFHSPDGLNWEERDCFTGIRHIHGVFHDPFTGSMWMTTGDSDAESAIWRSDDGGGKFRPVLSGSQKVRAVPLLFTRDGVFFGSDAPEQANHIYCLDRTTLKARPLHAVEGTVFHACVIGEWLFFSTAVEPSAVNRSTHSVLYASKGGMEWEAISRLRKDPWSMRFFQYGQLVLPTGENRTGALWYSAFALENDHTVFASIWNN